MNEIRIGKTLTTSLGDTIVIEKNGKEAILYRKGEVENQYIYAHNIELDESKNKYVWSAGEYYSSLSDCMVNVIVNQKESFYELIDNAHKLHHSNYIKGIVRAETEVEDENFLESIYEKYLDSEGIDDIFCDDFKKLLTNDMGVELDKEKAEEFADKINNVREVSYSVNDFKDRDNPIAAKLEFEYEVYKNDLKNKDVEYIIDRSFETYYRDNIVIAAKNIQFTEEDEEVLLNKENLLDELYDDWLDCDFDEMEGYLNSVAESKDKIMQHHMNKCIDKNKEAGYEPEL